jgi:hypothetical protein
MSVVTAVAARGKGTSDQDGLGRCGGGASRASPQVGEAVVRGRNSSAMVKSF